MLLSRTTFKTCLALGLLALAPLGAVRGDDTEAPKKGPLAAELQLRESASGKAKGKAPLLRRLTALRQKKADKSAPQPTTQQANPK